MVTAFLASFGASLWRVTGIFSRARYLTTYKLRASSCSDHIIDVDTQGTLKVFLWDYTHAQVMSTDVGLHFFKFCFFVIFKIQLLFIHPPLPQP